MNELRHIFESYWDKCFVIDAAGDAIYTYRDYFSKAMAYCVFFESLGLKPGARIGVSLENSVDLLAIYFACLLGNYVVMPFDPQGGRQNLPNVNFDHLVAEPLVCDYAADKAELIRMGKIKPDDIFLITFTSGTTGNNKGVIHTFSNLYKSAKAFAAKFGYGPEHTFYHNLPMSYMAGILNQFIMPMVSGSRIVVGGRFGIGNAMNFWDYPIKYGCNVLWLNPTIISVLNNIDRGLAGIEYIKNNDVLICVGTAPLYDEVKKTFESKYGTRLYTSYGLSEVLFITTESPVSGVAVGTVGEVLDGVDLSFGDDGEIHVTTAWDLLGYTNEDVEGYYSDGFYRTGDLGYIENGLLFINGRKKDIIIKGGINLSAARLEAYLYRGGMTGELAVAGVRDPVLGERVVLFYTGDEPDKAGLNALIASELGAPYKVDTFIKLESMPKNLNGKIDKNALRAIDV